MSEVVEYSFRTKTGSCTITPERIVLTREGVRGAVAERSFGSSIGNALVIYGVLGTAALVFGITSLVSGDVVSGGFLCLVGTLLIWNVIANRNNSATPVIERSSIRGVEGHPPRPPVTRGYFAVWFEDGGTVRKRLIMLPGSMENGNEEYKRAETAMRKAGLLDDK